MTDIRAPFMNVGQTAIFIAWARRLESRRPDALFHDPFAEELLSALASDPALGVVSTAAKETTDNEQKFPDYFAVRTRFLDEALLDAMNRGIRQIVALAAGMDGRTFRLPCPADVRWYEVDLPDVTVVKNELVARSRLSATCERRGVAADMTSDWMPALRDAGFDPSAPTAWLIEGLLYYLTEQAVDDLLTTVTARSAPGSMIFLDHMQTSTLYGDDGRQIRAAVQNSGSRWLSARDDVGPWLARFGWNANVYAGDDPRIGHGRKVGSTPACWLVSGELTAPDVT
jgi:methyltransferase (TIGR00027 family)